MGQGKRQGTKKPYRGASGSYRSVSIQNEIILAIMIGIIAIIGTSIALETGAVDSAHILYPVFYLIEQQPMIGFALYPFVRFLLAFVIPRR